MKSMNYEAPRYAVLPDS